MTERRARLYLAITALLWSSGGILIKLVDAGPAAVAGLRSLIAFAVLAAVFRPRMWPLNRPLVAGALCYAGTVICFVAATKWTSAANAILLQSTAPVHVAIFGRFYLGERIRPVDVATLLTVLVGMLFFFGDEISLEGMKGNLLGLAAGLCFAWLLLIARKHEGRSSPLAMVVLGNLAAAALTLPFFIDGPWPSSRGWLGLVLLGVFQLGLPYALYAKAAPRLRAIDAVLILLIEPVLNPIWVYLVLAERPGTWSIVGGIIVVGAVTLRSIYASLPRRSRA